MYHSLTFGNKNTWDSYHLIPDSRPVIAPPEPKTEYVDIPGADGSLDYTEALGSVKFGNRSGSWTFYVMNDYGEKNYDYDYWYQLYSDLLSDLHGRHMLVWSEDDPDYVYEGRITLDTWASEKDYSKVTIGYVFDPYKYKGGVNTDGYVEKDTTKSTANNDWLWDDLFDNTIIYGKFDVVDSKMRNLINRTSQAFEIAITCTNDMKVEANGSTIQLKNGRNRNSGVYLKPGDNYMKFIGQGRVTIDYDKDGVVL